ncbi:GspH/FimT family pseudopilin [Marinobacter sediminicola]|uniref:GspH/FimT family pseudopilin n=1 Tax=Marinobacter sediminicola TaxID=3072994 RepID=UPI002811C184|nr:GspH/FimT family pseudopilin [Marinobacter sp. F26243]
MTVVQNRGLTLVELLITLTILSVVFSIALPAMNREVSKSRQRELVATYNGAFSFARSQAVHTGTFVTICPLSSNNQCVDDWALPAAIFPDQDKDLRPDSNTVWKLISPVSNYRITSRTGGRGYLTFGPNGLTHGASGSLIACPVQSSRQPMSYLGVNRGGRFHAVHDDNFDNKIRLSWGALIQC